MGRNAHKQKIVVLRMLPEEQALLEFFVLLLRDAAVCGTKMSIFCDIIFLLISKTYWNN